MNCRNFVYVLLILLAGVLQQTVVHASDNRPNVIVIIGDDQGWTDYGFMGHEVVQTPNLDRLARRSLVFERGYVTAPLCRPSLASIATGLYPYQHRITGNDVNGRVKRAQLDKPVQQSFSKRDNFIRLLTANGYLAHQSGKWWEGGYQNGGFTHGMTHGIASKGGRHGDDGLIIGRKGIKPIEDFVDAATQQEKPFLIWYAPFLPHTPHNPPSRLLKKYQSKLPNDESKYYAMCEWFDETCGLILELVERKELMDNTIVVFICDNGWAAASSNKNDPNQRNWPAFALRSKGSPYELGIRTPIMISWPGQIRPERSSHLAQSIDLFPTIANAVGLTPPPDLPGIDLLNEKAASKRQALFGASYSIHNMNPEQPDETVQYQWCIDGHWKLILRHSGLDTTTYKRVHQWDRKKVQLFDLAKDPHEKMDVSDQKPDVVRNCLSKIEKWHKIKQKQN